AHRFAQLYPQDVAGLVWLDALHRDWDDFMPPAAGLAAVEQMAYGVAVHIKAWADLILTEPRFAPGAPSSTARPTC
ncbi:MAG: alpha/beta hydrolase fold protein, partial [Sphaerisporangium sp.]|nr:alpha/beta hydrolase fold protein [Sphaerisporangium sp.]